MWKQEKHTGSQQHPLISSRNGMRPNHFWNSLCIKCAHVSPYISPNDGCVRLWVLSSWRTNNSRPQIPLEHWNPLSGGNVLEHSYPDFSFQEDDPLAKYLIHAATHMACARTTTLITGCRIVHMTLATSLRPMVPPGKKLTRYQASATSWTTEAIMT